MLNYEIIVNCEMWNKGYDDDPPLLPCLEVAEFLGDDFANVNAEPVDDALREVRMRRTAEYFYVRHSALQNGPPGFLQVCS